MAEPDADDFRWLLGDEARPYLALTGDSQDNLVVLTKRLRQHLSAARTHLVLEEIELREKARDKFSRADEMFFTRRLLEQATDERIARYKAKRLPEMGTVLDLCCGLGGDLIGLAPNRPCRAVDRDPVAVLLAEANARVYGISSMQAVCADVTAVEISDSDVWHLDPDRRASGKRTTQLTSTEPSLETIDRLLVRQPNAALKLAPATEVPEPWRRRAELEWISSRRECRQQVAWFGNLAESFGIHRATIVTRDGQSHSLAGLPQTEVPVTERIGRYLFDLDSALRAAALHGAACEQLHLSALTAPNNYFTSDTPSNHPLVSCFEVLEVLPFDLKRLRAVLRQRGVGRLEIKVRGADVDPGRLALQLKRDGDSELTLLISGTSRLVQVALARRLTPYN